MVMAWWHRGVLAAVVGLSWVQPASAAPKVAVSINPVHSLVAAVMDGVAIPALLVRGAASPHTYALRPSDARAIEEADVIVRVGPNLEGFLERPIAALSRTTRVVTLMEDAGLTLLPAREGGTWERHEDHDHAHGHDADETDAHVWLDPENAERIVAHVAAVLREVDRTNAAAYARNEAAAITRLRSLDADLRAGLAPVRAAPFVVFHDAYQYFERRYRLNAVGSVVVTPERRPSAKRLRALRAKLVALGARCVFAEPQFQPALLTTIVEGTDARTGTLDPEGAAIPPGPDAYFTLMRNLRDALVGCLKEDG
jgi:zinc transport system substrate-binding protein